MTPFTSRTKAWLNTAVFYQIYPSSFQDSNGDGIGDLQGIISRLDYLQKLGISGIWISPIYDSPFRDGGYDVRDFCNVAERFGNNDDAVKLFHEAHNRGLRVLLDLVPGHTSDEHAWFADSKQATPVHYADRYIWTDDWIAGGDGLPFIAGTADRNGAYITNFFSFQPALNYGFGERQRVWQTEPLQGAALDTAQALVDVIRFWLELGADGFRVDMADSLVKFDDAGAVGKEQTRRVWQWVFDQVRPDFPDAVFVSEWGRPDQSLDAGFDMDFYLDWRWDGIPNGYNMLLRNTSTPLEHDDDASYFNADSATGIAPFLAEYEPRLGAAQQAGGLFDFITCNHDTVRVRPRLSELEVKLAYATLLTLPGAPFVYYGDEIGMCYRTLPTKEGGYVRTGTRTPMQWDSAQTNDGFSTASAEDLYLPVDPDPDAESVNDAIDDVDSLWHVVHDLIALKKQHAALGSYAGYRTLFSSDTQRSYVFERFSDADANDGALDAAGAQRVIVAVNPSRHAETVSLQELPDGWSGKLTALYTVNDVSASDDMLTLGAQSFAVFMLGE
ncbi:alpha-amylase family glycosyl hydrolase [Bifidobacterium gallicum]|uniref:Alpha amylase, catalytic domain protein n=1 Tax=Bifidobacterium gallicum DSM 20093 = LMG 11596 TaxID=561180 RepID=D1NX22_9BIFI|nr:alpha-amylase family glycosyl hydrolase [Bifidobacterium gallicum]EFA22082.1 alpha amylase, catalytic domain protein [Bifidobacterium gallicum DSM 20093 = LMG 11596]KFI59350.1 alpha-amylase [Bifidobacterium gallicum DSM 20093 = LMG 11596]